MILQALNPSIGRNPQTNGNVVNYFAGDNTRTVEATKYNHVRVRIGNGDLVSQLSNPTEFSWEDYGNGEELRLELPARPEWNQVNAYWLPWEFDTGYHVDIPANAPAADLFVTPPLSGCYVGVQNMPGSVRIYHYNAEPALTADDLQRYGCHTWLVYDQDITPELVAAGAVPYPRNTAVWGEYIGNAWHFFYKTMGDTKIHYIPY